MSIVDITEKQARVVQQILQKYLPSHSIVWVFGSRAKMTAKKYSDLDLAIDAKMPLSLSIMANLAYDFEESELPYKVDIVDWNTIEDSFKALIKSDRIVFWKGE